MDLERLFVYGAICSLTVVPFCLFFYFFVVRVDAQDRNLIDRLIWVPVRPFVKGDGVKSARECRSDFFKSWLPFA